MKIKLIKTLLSLSAFVFINNIQANFSIFPPLDGAGKQRIPDTKRGRRAQSAALRDRIRLVKQIIQRRAEQEAATPENSNTRR